MGERCLGIGLQIIGRVVASYLRQALQSVLYVSLSESVSTRVWMDILSFRHCNNRGTAVTRFAESIISILRITLCHA